jgi:micrococcal nuclease
VLRWRPRYGDVDRAPLTRSAAFRATLTVALLAAAGCSSRIDNRTIPSETTTLTNVGVVVSVSDGDTFTVKIDGKKERVRLIGVDTPETVHPTKGVQCFGPEASDFTKHNLAIGTRVRLVRDVEARDKYKRLLAYVYLVDSNVFYNLELVRLGYARPYPFPPNTTHQGDFAAAAWEAQGNARGLWGACG